MSLTLGPVLGLAASADTDWTVAAVAVFRGEEPPPARFAVAACDVNGDDVTPDRLDKEVEPELLERRGDRRIVRYRFAIARMADREQTCGYEIGEASHSFRVPAGGRAPRMGFGSCNGFSDPATMKKVQVKNALWRAPEDAAHQGILDARADARLHLLLMGGDQIYADQIWGSVDCLKDFQDLDIEQQIERDLADGDEDAIAAFYLDLYERRWTQPEVRDAFASIPSIMMWDDHDIIDGWGSYEEKLLESPVYKAIFRQAARHFDMFQRQTRPEGQADSAFDDNARGAGYDLGGGVHVIALDMRTERRIHRVMGDRTWAALKDHLQELGERGDARHLLVMSSIPVVHPDMSWLEGPIGFFGSELEDDLRDHWNSHAHKGERLRLVHRLFALNANGVRVTFLSGDVHVGAAGAIEWTQVDNSKSYANRIEQLTSSGIVHKGPPGPMLFFLEQLAVKPQEFDPDTRARMVKLPGSQNVFIGDRNWLALQVDRENRIWAAFHVEGQSQPFEKVIHPVGDGRQDLLRVATTERGFTRAPGN